MKRRPKNTAKFVPATQAKPKSGPADSTLSPRRKWLFRLLLVVIVPTLFFGALEMGLRIAGYGHSTKLFKSIRVGDSEFLVNDDLFALQFFPPEMTRSPSSFRIEAKKPPGTYRIFILGESAAMGDPEPAYGAGRYLEVLLREKFPGANFEIVNLGITAINSHVIVPIARECAQHEGDLWIIYMGNNEMVGPFGAATVFGAQAPPVGIVRLRLAIQRTRTGQLLAGIISKLRPAKKAAAWGGMQMFVENKLSPNDPRRQIVYKNFECNLRDIIRAGLDSSAKVLLNTVAVNLKDCPPFASLPNSNLPPEMLARYEQSFAEGISAQKRGDFTEAESHFAQAVGIDSRSAQAHFQLGQCRLHLTNSEAATALQIACDCDALPFRADSRINKTIRQIAAQFPDDNLRLLDAGAALGSNNPAGVCGQETFYEHVHFNFDGSYRLACAWAAQIEPLLPATITAHSTGDWASQEICERRLGLTDWNRRAIYDSVISRLYAPPLSTQPNNHERIAALQARSAELHARQTPDAAQAARELYLDAINRAPNDYYPRQNFASFLAATGEAKEAIAEWRRAHELVPNDFVTDFQLGNLLARQGQFAEAELSLSEALASHPGFSEAWLELGKTHAAEAKLNLALSELDRARQLRPEDPAAWTQRGMVLSRLNRSDESIASFREAIRARPDYWEAHYTLGGELGTHGQIAEARREFEEVVRLKPDHAGAHLNLGVALLKQNELDAAEREFRETLRLEPNNKIAPTYHAQVQAMKARRH